MSGDNNGFPPQFPGGMGPPDIPPEGVPNIGAMAEQRAKRNAVLAAAEKAATEQLGALEKYLDENKEKSPDELVWDAALCPRGIADWFMLMLDGWIPMGGDTVQQQGRPPLQMVHIRRQVPRGEMVKRARESIKLAREGIKQAQVERGEIGALG